MLHDCGSPAYGAQLVAPRRQGARGRSFPRRQRSRRTPPRPRPELQPDCINIVGERQGQAGLDQPTHSVDIPDGDLNMRLEVQRDLRVRADPIQDETCEVKRCRP